MKTNLNRTLSITLCIMSATLHAAIMVENTAFDDVQDLGGGGNATITFNYNLASGGNILVVAAHADVTSAGQNITFSFDTTNYDSATSNFIWQNGGAMSYYETGALDTSVSITVDTTANQMGYVLWELSGVDLSAGVAQSITDSITTTSDNTYVVGAGFRNGSVGGLAPTLAPTGVYTQTDIAPFDIGTWNNLSNPNAAIGGASGLAATAGNYDMSWANDDRGNVAFGFVAIPEPSSLALVGLAMISFLTFRCRKRV